MTTLNRYTYPVDLLRQFDGNELNELRVSLEVSGWSAHSWGVDTHDTIEFTLLHKGELDDSNDFVSLYIGSDDGGGIRYSVETLSQRGEETSRATVDSGVMRELTAEELGGLLERGMHGSAAAAADLITPMLAAIGAVQFSLHTVSVIVANLVNRTGGAVREIEVKLEDGQARWSEFQEELPEQFEQLRGKLSPEELKSAAEAYVDQARAVYEQLIERGEAALERVRDQLAIEGGADADPSRAAPGGGQSRAVGERAAKLVGVELPARADVAAVAKKSPARKMPAKHAMAKKMVSKKVAGRKVASGQTKTVRLGNTTWAVKRDR